MKRLLKNIKLRLVCIGTGLLLVIIGLIAPKTVEGLLNEAWEKNDRRQPETKTVN